MKVKSLSHARPLATPWTEAYQAPPSTGVSRQEYWSGVPLPSLRVLEWGAIAFSGIRSLGGVNPIKEEMTIHSRILA